MQPFTWVKDAAAIFEPKPQSAARAAGGGAEGNGGSVAGAAAQAVQREEGQMPKAPLATAGGAGSPTASSGSLTTRGSVATQDVGRAVTDLARVSAYWGL